MNAVDVALAARSYQMGRGLRSASVRHRRLVDAPLMVVLWQLGAEPFSAAALGWGTHPERMAFSVAGDPRNRDLALSSLLPFARWVNSHFEAPAADREPAGSEERVACARSAPQVVVGNGASAELLGRLGRRLAWLPTTGERPADPALVRLGRHLLFLRDQLAVAGQQLVVPLTDLLGAHWATAQSPAERQSLAALDAWIDPPAGLTGFEAAARAEGLSAGPVALGNAEEELAPLVERFNRLRAGRTDPAVVGPLLKPIEAFYRPLVERAWALLWRCWRREAALAEARSVERRWRADRVAYSWHAEWLARNGLRRARQAARQAALTLDRLERAGAQLEAEEACDDPLRMLPLLLAQRAVRGLVVRVDPNHVEVGRARRVRRPVVMLHSSRPCRLPVGKELWWTEQASGREYRVQSVVPAGGGAEVTLVLQTGSDAPLPAVGREACFADCSTAPGYFRRLPEQTPWTHQPPAQLTLPGPIEEEERG